MFWTNQALDFTQRDNERLLNTLKNLRDLGNTCLLSNMMKIPCWQPIILLISAPARAPMAEKCGQGTIEDIKACPDSITGQYQSGKKKIEVPTVRHQPNGKWLEVLGAAQNNLKDLDVKIPLGVFTCVTGVSGSGKSTLVNEVLFKGLQSELRISSKVRPGLYKEIRAWSM
jgi:excinuclease ABC subunit A